MALITGTPGVIVDQPNVGNARYGLFSAANGPFAMPSPHAAVSGITYSQLHCGEGELWPAATCPPGGDLKNFPDCDGFALGYPFNIIGAYQAGALGLPQEEFTRRAVIRLNDNAQFLVEEAFWGGRTAAPAVPDLLTSSAITPVDVTGGVAVPIEEAVGKLEEFLAAYSYRSIMHARPVVSPYATERLLSVPDGKPGAPGTRYFTPMGNVWSFGRGYSGNHPVTGVAPGAGEAYIVASGPVTLWKGEVYTNPPFRAMDRAHNQVYVLAEQPWVGTIDCLWGFALTTLDGQ